MLFRGSFGGILRLRPTGTYSYLIFGGFDKIRTNPSGAFYLSANIDAKDIDGIYPLSLGCEKNAFTGVFINPNKYWISNLSITPKEDPDFSNVFHSSLFGSVYKAYIDRIIDLTFFREHPLLLRKGDRRCDEETQLEVLHRIHESD